MLTVNDLRRHGFKVRIQHRRHYGYEKNGSVRYYDEHPLSKGGVTEVLVTDPETNQNVFGVSRCSVKENFNRKRGVRIALGRALKQLGLPTK